MKKKDIIKLLILIFILIGIPMLLYIVSNGNLFNKNYLSNIMRNFKNNKFLEIFILILFQILQIIICILPGQPIQLYASYNNGILGGFLISIIGAVIGTFITYNIANLLGKDAIKSIFNETKVEKYMKKLSHDKVYTIIFIIYLIPGFPKDLISYLAGISEIKIKPFLILSTIGRMPGLLGSLLVGSFLAKKNYIGIMILSIIVAIIFLISYLKKDAIMKLVTENKNHRKN